MVAMAQGQPTRCPTIQTDEKMTQFAPVAQDLKISSHD